VPEWLGPVVATSLASEIERVTAPVDWACPPLGAFFRVFFGLGVVVDGGVPVVGGVVVWTLRAFEPSPKARRPSDLKPSPATRWRSTWEPTPASMNMRSRQARTRA
jgi:hypothetical protein